MRRVLPIAVAAAALTVSQLPATAHPSPDSVSAGVALSAAAQKKVRTPFALFSSSYGSRIEGGSIPANSRDTAFQRIGCTNKAGTDRNNYEADLVLPGLGKAEGVRSRTWTEKSGGTVSSNARHSIAKLTIGLPSLGSLEIRGLSSESRAFNRNGKFGTSFDNEIARIVLKAAGQPAAEIPIPAPNRTVTIPGLLELSLGKANRKVTRDSARISTNVLDVTVLPVGTRVRVAQTNTRIQSGIRQGVFRGYSAGLEAKGLADNLKVGRTPLNIVPCRGNASGLKNIAGVDLGDLGSVSGVAAGQDTSNRARVAKGTVAGRVANVELFDGRIEINGILGVANVKRERGRLTRNSDGSTVLEIVFDGRKLSFPALGKLTIPGLVELQDRVEVKTKNGIRVIGLRVKVLDGTGAVLDLGVAELGIRPGVRADS
jgi:hypothetical protein